MLKLSGMASAVLGGSAGALLLPFSLSSSGFQSGRITDTLKFSAACASESECEKYCSGGSKGCAILKNGVICLGYGGE